MPSTKTLTHLNTVSSRWKGSESTDHGHIGESHSQLREWPDLAAKYVPSLPLTSAFYFRINLSDTGISERIAPTKFENMSAFLDEDRPSQTEISPAQTSLETLAKKMICVSKGFGNDFSLPEVAISQSFVSWKYLSQELSSKGQRLPTETWGRVLANNL